MLDFKEYLYLTSLCEKVSIAGAEKKIKVNVEYDTEKPGKIIQKLISIIKDNFLQQAAILMGIGGKTGFENIGGNLDITEGYDDDDEKIIGVELVVGGETPKPEEILYMMINFYTKSDNIEIDIQRIHPRLQQLGLVKILHRKMSQLLSDPTFKRFKKYTIGATTDIGSYAWIKFGFTPDDVDDFLEEIDSHVKSVAKKKVLQKIINMKDEKKKYELLDVNVALFKKIILDNEIMWGGSLNLSGKKMLKAFRKKLSRNQGQREKYKMIKKKYTSKNKSRYKVV